MIKIVFKRILAVPLMVLGVVFMIFGVYGNFFLKLPIALERASDGFASAGIILGTLIGTGILIAICVGIIALGYSLWHKE